MFGAVAWTFPFCIVSYYKQERAEQNFFKIHILRKKGFRIWNVLEKSSIWIMHIKQG